MTDGESETAVSASLQKIKLIKNQHKKKFSIFYLIKSQTSDSFVNYFDGHFAYLKTLDFSFNAVCQDMLVVVVVFCCCWFGGRIFLRLVGFFLFFLLVARMSC